MDKLVFMFAVTVIVLQSEVRCQECVDDVKINCAMMASVFGICTVNREKAAKLCPKTCNLCYPDDNWADWSSWSGCSVTCGNSLQTRTRTCTNPPPLNNNTSCEGASKEHKSCLNEPCSVPAAWGPWGAWGTCSSTCDAGIQHRERIFSRPFSTRKHDHCVGDSAEEQICVQRACADGKWTKWSTWSTCSVTCGGGLHQRTRDCTDPHPSPYGRYCTGLNNQVSACNSQNCPQTAGGWAGWSSWSTCTSSCGGGVHQRYRGCTNPAPSPYGQPCNGNSLDVMTCNKQTCASEKSAVPQVRFHAQLSTRRRSYTTNQDIVYSSVLINDGGGYSPITGHFTAPVAGVYMFTVQYCPDDNNWAHLEIVHAGRSLQSSAHKGEDYVVCVSMQAFAKVAMGNKVWVRATYASAIYHEDSNRSTSFAGLLVSL